VYHDTVATVATVAVATCTVPGKKSSIGKRFHLHVRLLFWQASCDQKLKNNFLLLFASMKLQAEDRFQFLEAFLQKPKLLLYLSLNSNTSYRISLATETTVLLVHTIQIFHGNTPPFKISIRIG
jgi:hypothetical protein